jgi:trehalose-6-phosphate synthase
MNRKIAGANRVLDARTNACVRLSLRYLRQTRKSSRIDCQIEKATMETISSSATMATTILRLGYEVNPWSVREVHMKENKATNRPNNQENNLKGIIKVK